jgi:hypothetical protein
MCWRAQGLLDALLNAWAVAWLLRRGYFIAPTVFADVTDEMQIAKEVPPPRHAMDQMPLCSLVLEMMCNPCGFDSSPVCIPLYPLRQGARAQHAQSIASLVASAPPPPLPHAGAVDRVRSEACRRSRVRRQAHAGPRPSVGRRPRPLSRDSGRWPEWPS